MHYPVTFGAAYAPDKTIFSLYAPSSDEVSLRLYFDGDAQVCPSPSSTHEMTKNADGSFVCTVSGDLNHVYYDYLLTYADGRKTVSSDPWAIASGIGGERSMVLDLSSAEPEGWENDTRPNFGGISPVIWETHVSDFSLDAHSGVSAANKGKYLAFTEDMTTLDGDGVHPTCVNYLKRLGVTHVQLQPIADIATVDERGGDSYNWGYDILQYNVPEGSYASDPYHGEVRVKECRAMIMALHKAGIGAVLDVVYNHTYFKHSSLDKTAPGEYYRHDENGGFLNASGCGCETASEREPFRNFMLQSVLYWAREYHVDGFRFDLMGIHDVETMNLIRSELDKLPDGKRILLYGEPWTCLPTGIKAPAVPVCGETVKDLDSRIGVFCGDTRISLTGSTFDPHDTGLGGGRTDEWHTGTVLRAAGGYSHPYLEPCMNAPSQCIQYASCHDNYTLFDRFVLQRGDADFDKADEETLQRTRFVSGVYMTCAGAAFFQSGEEFCRTKKGNGNSYNGPASLNSLDWTRAAKHCSLVAWYRGLIGIRRLMMPCLDADTILDTVFLTPPEKHGTLFMKYVKGSEYNSFLVCYNPTCSPVMLYPPRGKWFTLCDGVTSTLYLSPNAVEAAGVSVPPMSVVILGSTD